MNNLNVLREQWDEMISRGTIPYFELELKDNEYLLVNLEFKDNGIHFSFDQNGLPVFFDGNIIGSDNHYLMPFDTYNAGEIDSESLDYYLTAVMENIEDGYILPNDLWPLDNEEL